MKALHRILALFGSLSLIAVLLITAAEGAIYLDLNYYQKEYEKYEVLEDLDMEMEDVMYVTREMMDYLHDRRGDLVVTTTVDGKEQEFFNDQDKFHMAEVKNIFGIAILIRWIALGVFAVIISVLIFMKANWMKLVSKWYMALTAVLALATGILAYLMTQNFNKYFVIFHEIFFDNDLWQFNPETDLMIRMLPEGLFADFAARIGIFAGAAAAVFFIISFVLYKIAKRKEEDLNLYNIS